MRSVILGCLAGFVTVAAATHVFGDGVVLGPRLATAPDTDPGELLVSELNCAACHHASDAERLRLNSRQSPVLGKTGLRQTPQYLRKYLNDPAGAKPASTMPDQLRHLSGNEKNETVEALVHYLVSEQDNTAQIGAAAEDYLIKQGRTLYHTVGCVACHEPETAPNSAAANTGDAPNAVDPSLRGAASVPLGDLARKTTVDQLARFLLNPQQIRPSGRMPSLALSATEATALAVYLLRDQAAALNGPGKRSLISGLQYQYFEENFNGDTDFGALTPKASGTSEGFDLTPRKRDNSFGFRFSGHLRVPQEGDYTFFTRSDDGSMLYIDGKAAVNNNGDHPPEEKRGTIHLTEGDHDMIVTFYNNGAGFELDVNWRGPGFNKQKIPASALSHYGQPMVPLDSADFAADPAKAAKGKELFASLGCASCHTINGQSLAGSSAAKPLAALKGASGGCLAENPPKGAARFDLSGEQRAALRQTLARGSFLAVDRSAKDQAAWTMASLNCYACHTRDLKGGPTAARAAYFRVVGEADMGDEGRMPPRLTAVGAKLRPQWTHEVLEKAGRVRPYMATRMPQFGSAQIGSLPELLEQADKRADERQAPEITQRDAKFGRKLAGTGGLSCIACHTVGTHKSLGIPAINLSMMSRRLKYDWFVRYLVDPPSLRPGTRMPSFWPNGEAANKDILGGNTQAQMNAIWAFLESHPETDLPPGLVQGRQELVAEKEPIIYRNFIQGAGPRAIGVGYPEKVNLAFDANSMRLAMIWQGSFIDASRHWNGRGEGFEPPLGNNVVKLPEGAPFAVLESDQAAWPSTAAKEAGFKMGGYRLDDRRRPTFFYSFKGLQIEDRCEPKSGEVDAYFHRTLAVRNDQHLWGEPVDHIWFRVATGKIESKGDSFVLNDKIVIKLPGAEAVLRGSDQNRELLVRARFQGDAATIVEEIIW